ncbi:MAG: D-tyrosyl-tRNA(Tyr) deacylase [Clostridia bacterium]|nr:D-tyrosyl-tRNA(Tyr) deacylase [Clostridia bacterium]
MKAVVQVVGQARLSVENKLISEIGQGLVVYFCVESGDLEEKLSFFAKKIANMRIFSDENDKINLSVKDVGGEILLVSQFTLAGNCEHGNRPSFFTAEEPVRAEKLYQEFGKLLQEEYGIVVKFGVFGADMTIEQTNRGPFTICLEK